MLVGTSSVLQSGPTHSSGRPAFPSTTCEPAHGVSCGLLGGCPGMDGCPALNGLAGYSSTPPTELQWRKTAMVFVRFVMWRHKRFPGRERNMVLSVVYSHCATCDLTGSRREQCRVRRWPTPVLRASRGPQGQRWTRPAAASTRDGGCFDRDAYGVLDYLACTDSFLLNTGRPPHLAPRVPLVYAYI